MIATELIHQIRSGELESADLEALVEALVPLLPPQDRPERNACIRDYVAVYGDPDAGANETAAWLILDFARFELSGDWKAWRRRRCCPVTSDRKRLMWRIRKFAALPARSTLIEILNLEQ